jgi:hypothetical protein
LVRQCQEEPPKIESAVDLGTADTYAILSKSKTGISTAPKSTVNGNIAFSPITVVATITGFRLVADS